MQDCERVNNKASGYIRFEELAKKLNQLQSNNGPYLPDEAWVPERKRDEKAATKKEAETQNTDVLQRIFEMISKKNQPKKTR